MIKKLIILILITASLTTYNDLSQNGVSFASMDNTYKNDFGEGNKYLLPVVMNEEQLIGQWKLSNSIIEFYPNGKFQHYMTTSKSPVRCQIGSYIHTISKSDSNTELDCSLVTLDIEYMIMGDTAVKFESRVSYIITGLLDGNDMAAINMNSYRLSTFSKLENELSDTLLNINIFNLVPLEDFQFLFKSLNYDKKHLFIKQAELEIERFFEPATGGILAVYNPDLNFNHYERSYLYYDISYNTLMGENADITADMISRVFVDSNLWIYEVVEESDGKLRNGKLFVTLEMKAEIDSKLEECDMSSKKFTVSELNDLRGTVYIGMSYIELKNKLDEQHVWYEEHFESDSDNDLTGAYPGLQTKDFSVLTQTNNKDEVVEIVVMRSIPTLYDLHINDPFRRMIELYGEDYTVYKMSETEKLYEYDFETHFFRVKMENRKVVKWGISLYYDHKL